MLKISNFKRDVILLFMAEMIWVIGHSMFSNYLPLYIKELGGNEFSVSLIASIPMFMGVAAIAGGILCDIVDRKYILLFGWGITVPAPFIWALATDWKWIAAGQIIFSLTTVCGPAIALYIFDYKVSENEEGSKMMAYSAIPIASTVGSLIGPIAGSRIIQLYNMKTLFIIVFIFYSLGTLFILPMKPQKPHKKIVLSEYFAVGDVKQLYNIKRLLVFTGFICMVAFAQNIAEPYLSIFLDGYKKLPLDWLGISFTVASIGAMLFTWSYGKAEEYLRLRWLLVGGMAIFAASVPVLLTGNSLPVIASGFFLRSINRAVNMYLNGFLARSLYDNRKGIILSLSMSARSIITGLASFAGAGLYRLGEAGPFVAEAVLMVILAAATFMGIFKGYFNGMKYVSLGKESSSESEADVMH